MINLLKKVFIDAPRNAVVSITCPYCFERFKLYSSHLRCINPKCDTAEDSVREKVWGDVRPYGLVITQGGWWGKAVCTRCGDITTQRLCPHCHMELPISIAHTRSMIFAVIGAKWAGKSHYLASLHETIKKKIGPDMDILMEPLDDRTMKQYTTRFYRPVFEEHRTIEATKSALTQIENQLPLVFSLTFSGRQIWKLPLPSRVVNLVFFDTAGEDMLNQNVMETVNRYIAAADGLILLLDPLQIETVRNQLKGTPMPSAVENSWDIIKRTTNVIRKRRSLSDSAQISIPIAVSFTKFDALVNILPKGLQLTYHPDRSEGYDTKDSVAVNDEVQELLDRWNCRDIVQQIKVHFKNTSFFGLSSLGCNPHKDSRIPEVKPKRVEDPFLWLLYYHGLLKPQAAEENENDG